MTGPGGYESGDTAPPPGWYPDPDGAAGQVRWWNGVSWSDLMTPAGPGVAVQHSPVLAPTAASSSGMIAPPEPPPGSGRGGAGSVIGLAIVALVAVFGVVLFVNRDQGAGETPTAETTPPPSSSSEPARPTFGPGTVRIFDDEAGVSYPYLGDGWYEWNLTGQVETTNTAGQYFVTQEVTPDGTTFIAQCTSGALGEGYGWTGAPSLESTLAAVADNVRGNYYPGPNDREVLRDEARTVDDHPAWLYEFQLSWDVPGYEATGERAALLLVDVGRPAPALIYISIPNTHAELYGVIDVVLDGVEVI